MNIKMLNNDKINSMINKLKSDKKNLLILAVGILGMFLILLSGSSDNDKKEKSDTSCQSSDFSSVTDITEDVENLLKSIKGAGKTKVMITFEASEETVYATDTEEKNNSDNNQIKKKHIITENDKIESGLKIKTLYPKVRGVAVVCEGGDDTVVKEKIYSLLSALFDISYTDISVASMV